ncbi:alanine racemase [Planococcus lenghuensis]|uniref:Alanine racemase n=1 Tax=Planococcus lenghuensis TaxID=2213202 RepID=A0A1Q2KY01_9BACL|nr:alanine racemase [Planococcus lenghuensis]AQQ53090.1 alanine racemase [Planococcus lenghuensis]
MTATLTINQTNLYDQARQLQGQTDVLAVVKNNAYNVGLDLAFRTFYKAGIRAFATTSLKEAVELRQLDDHIAIFLMNPSTDFDKLRENRIAMTLPSLPFFREHEQDLQGIDVHLEYKNLLRRSGFDRADEMFEVLEAGTVNVTGVWTHFAFADEIGSAEYEKEKQDWLDLLESIRAEARGLRFIHAQNSASFVRDGLFPGHTHARLGILLYGSRPYSGLPESLAPAVVSVSANIIQTIRLKAGESSGYSSAFRAEKDCVVAIADIGYGDGVLRTRAKHEVLINGRRYPIGALMMSHLLVVVDEDVQPGDTVYLYNDVLRVDHYTFLGVGANSEQMSALNHNSLTKEILA